MYLRTLQKPLERLAGQYPVVTLTGPRQSGKTTLCRATFKNHAYVSLEDLEIRQLALQDPRGFLAQFKDGVILDEFQRAPDLPSYIQGIVDETNRPGQFILTGSQQLEISQSVSQSLAGRTAILKLLPLSYGELYGQKQVPIENIIYSGFYPRIHAQALEAREALSFYVTTYVERDIRLLQNIQDLTTFEQFLKLCATQVGQLTNFARLGNDCGIDQKTVKAWLTLLEASFIIFRLPPHFDNLRKRITKASKLYFFDVGLAAYLLGIATPEHVAAHPLRGALFENFIVTEFLKARYNQAQSNNLYFFRDHVGNEVDLIADEGVNRLAVEIKMGKTIQPDFVKSLQFYQKSVEKHSVNAMIVYGGERQGEFLGVKWLPYFNLGAL